MKIRTARLEDAPALAQIRNWAAVASTALFDDSTTTAADREQWLSTIPAAFVAVDNDKVIGYASYGSFRIHSGYLHTVENSVYVLPGHQGKGIGKSLLNAVIRHAEDSPDVHRMVAWIESTNAASLALHRKNGFQEMGTLTEVGYKFNRWLDVTIMQRNCQVAPVTI